MRPTDRDTIAVLRIIAALMGETCTYSLAGSFYFPVGPRWALRVSPDDAGRFRLQACHGGRSVATMWCLSEDRDRLADLVLGFKAEALAVTT